ncbi:BT_3987 domain-containing protein [Mucilaginibacter sp. R-33]|uniref:BT_3987 domain-containing protein n=1 Tax=Mucilaginibacter sp. R-33 TaxID=3416711 RepID=UPI003CE75F91
MKKNNYGKLIIAASLVIFQSCRNDVVLPPQDESSYNQIYMPQAVNGLVSSTLEVKATEQFLVYGANYGGKGYPGQDIKVSFKADTALVASYNTANGTSYQVLPRQSYNFSATEAILKKGELATQPLKVTIQTTGNNAIPMFVNYLLPVTISADFKINQKLRTTYFLVSSEPSIADYPDYDRTGWSVVDFSSQESSGEGPNNGRAIFALDNNVNTYWHAQWTGSGSVLPHYVTFDMGTVKSLHGFNFTQRQINGDGGKADSVEIQTSVDKINWARADGFHLQSVQAQQKKWLSKFTDARYVKYVVISTHGGVFSSLAEFGAF